MKKTCGNCGHCADRYGHYLTNDGVCLRVGVAVCKSKHLAGCAPCGIEWIDGDYGPAGWVSRTDTQEQRNEQLEQVAIEMWQYIHSQTIEDETPEWTAQLEAFGVVLDDDS